MYSISDYAEGKSKGFRLYVNPNSIVTSANKERGNVLFLSLSSKHMKTLMIDIQMMEHLQTWRQDERHFKHSKKCGNESTLNYLLKKQLYFKI